MAVMNGELFEALMLAGASNLNSDKKEINDLNVFPIPDGDTGENMYMTYMGGISLMQSEQSQSVEKKADALARGMLLSARGNSGVILSQFFRGLALGLDGVESATVENFKNALSEAKKQAYLSVVTPVEGTVLTVAREACESVLLHEGAYIDFKEFFSDYTEAMSRSLDRTPELLPVLKEAGVVDSGGAGLLSIFSGMLKLLKGESISISVESSKPQSTSVDFSSFNENSVMTYGYCTEFLLQLQNSKVDAHAFDESIIIDYLKTVGDSLAVFKTGTVVKVHVHTMTPYKALEFCQKFGEFLTVKIENMTLQHTETKESTEKKKALRQKRERRKLAIVTVGVGAGIAEVFTELGADFVVDGGQGKNPSIEDFVGAFDYVNADDVFVLPNNSNIIMAAKQAASVYSDSSIHVIETKNFGEAYSILSALDFSSGDAETIIEQMNENMQSSVTGMVTTSIRSVVLDGVSVKEGEYIGFTNKTMLVSKSDRVDAFSGLLQALDAKNREFLIVFYGADTTDADKARVKSLVSQNYPNVELYDIDGGQDVYDFIVILE